MTDTTEASTVAAETAQGLREFADLIERYPEFARVFRGGGQRLLMYVGDWEEDAEQRFADLARKLGGERRKDADDDFFHAIRRFGAIEVQLYTDRKTVCARKVVGTREVTRPDPDAPKVTVTEDIVEWECSPLLAEAVDR